jgi:predicted nucleic acid-binding protein
MGLSPSRLTDLHDTLVIDASVAINLLGSGSPDELLRVLQRRVVIEEAARNEVWRNPINRQPARGALDRLVDDGLLRYQRLSDRAYSVFVELTGADPPDDLGDGEAATIAHAEDIAATIVVDDRKAERIAVTRGSSVAVLSTLDVLSAAAVVGTLDRDRLADLTTAMLQNARMRVSTRFREWVTGLIGPERAAQCQSLGAVFSPIATGARRRSVPEAKKR